MTAQHIQFVTGRLAAPALRQVVDQLHQRLGFSFSIAELPITVAALMTPQWVSRKFQPDERADLIVLPGYCQGDLQPIQQMTSAQVTRGPRDLYGLPEFFGQQMDRSDYGTHAVEILAEINHANRLSLGSLLKTAKQLAQDGADVIDLGCSPGQPWEQIGSATRMLTDEGFRVSVDSFDPLEISSAVEAGAELVLSVNRSNRAAAVDWGCEVVVIPDEVGSLHGLAETAHFLLDHQIPFRLDPILEPIGCGFTKSLRRYMDVREQFPEAATMMGIGNLTELTDVDSAGLNVLLLAICTELGIGSILTTQVIPWAQSSVRECDLARRLVHYAVSHQVIPKHLEPGLVMLRDTKRYPQTTDQIADLAKRIRDQNYRIFADDGELHLLNRNVHFHDRDPFVVFARLMEQNPTNVDASHAFYLGYELCKALTALTLDKQYRQDQSLDWGFLTRPETSHRAGPKRATQEFDQDDG